MAMSDQNDVEFVFGALNVQRWADADNTGNATIITNRITWANDYAEQEFLGRIAEGPYDMEEVRTTLPKMAVYICASLAGVYLYDTRRVVDSESNSDRVAKQKKNVDRWIAQIMGGQLKLLDPTTYIPLKKTAQNSPSTITSE
jgi:hypothetical protein